MRVVCRCMCPGPFLHAFQSLSLRLIPISLISPTFLSQPQILELDLGSLTAGCMMPGEFEERLKAVLNEVRLAGSWLRWGGVAGG